MNQPKEPLYLKNICPTCHEPMLGVHLHESDECPCMCCGGVEDCDPLCNGYQPEVTR